jgi:ABC-type multidrug transport system ATPase subunit
MLTGEISMTDGNAYVNNYSVIKQLDHVRKNIGYAKKTFLKAFRSSFLSVSYCPQFDALDSLLTAREHLYFYARLRGIKQKNISFVDICSFLSI